MKQPCMMHLPTFPINNMQTSTVHVGKIFHGSVMGYHWIPSDLGEGERAEKQKSRQLGSWLVGW